MFRHRIETQADVTNQIIEVDVNFLSNGRELYFGDNMIGPSLEADYDYERAFKLAGGFSLKGAAEVIPGDRAIFVTPYNGVHVPAEHTGFAVTVPIKGTRTQRKKIGKEFGQPSDFRYLHNSELDTNEGDLCISAVTRAVYEVAMGIGASGADKYQAMIEGAKNQRLINAESEKEEIAIQQIMSELDPTRDRISSELWESMRSNNELSMQEALTALLLNNSKNRTEAERIYRHRQAQTS